MTWYFHFSQYLFLSSLEVHTLLFLYFFSEDTSRWRALLLSEDYIPFNFLRKCSRNICSFLLLLTTQFIHLEGPFYAVQWTCDTYSQTHLWFKLWVIPEDSYYFSFEELHYYYYYWNMESCLLTTDNLIYVKLYIWKDWVTVF